MKSTFNKAGYGLAWTVLNAFLNSLAFISPAMWLVSGGYLPCTRVCLYLGDALLKARNLVGAS